MKHLKIVAVMLLLLASFAAAKDYKELIGPYKANFTLPNDVASLIEVEKITSSSETFEGIPYDEYSLNLKFKEPIGMIGQIWFFHYPLSTKMDFNAVTETIEGTEKEMGFTTCNSARRIIDAHEGLLVNCFGSAAGYHESYWFGYQLDNHTIINGYTALDWDTGMVPFLRSLHIEES